MLSVTGIKFPNIVDYEHQRIIQQLMQLGITPTYNKSTDQALLSKAKNELITKIQNKNEENYNEIVQRNDFSVDENYYKYRAEMEERRLGAMTISDLNRYFLLAS